MTERSNRLFLAASCLLVACDGGQIVDAGARSPSVLTSNVPAAVALAPLWTRLSPASAHPGRAFTTTTHAPSLNAVFAADAPDYAVGSLARFNLVTNKWTVIATTNWPIGKFRRIVFDPDRARIVTYWDGIGEAWAVPIAGGAWTRVGQDANSDLYYEGGPFWNPVSRKVSSYGGYGYFEWRNTIWEFDALAGHWALGASVGSAPWPRFAASVAVDEERKALFITGGEGSASGGQYDPSARFLNDLWLQDLVTGQWRNIVQLQPAYSRYQAPIAYVHKHRAVYRFGGWDDVSRTIVNELQVAAVGTQLSNFVPVTTRGVAPSPRRSGSLYYDEKRKRLVHFGGVEGLAYMPDVWALPLK